MFLTVNGHKIYAYTGGKAFNAAQPTVVFIHGVLNDHSVWILQSRYMANHGWNVLAIDLPGQGKSGGEPPTTVEEAADTIIALLAAAGLNQAALVGHSFGSLIALETAARAPAHVSHLVMAGAACPMKVSPALLESSVKAPEKAIAMVNQFSHSMLAPPPSAFGPGSWLYGGSRALMRRMLASNSKTNVFYTGFKACDSYSGGEQAMAAVHCPTLFLIGRNDQMTPPKSAKALAAHARLAKITEVNAGHSLMTEAPDEVLFALREFLLE
ncbi:alpha/beta fold hydrolase [Ottowia thiooxydans]|uniref:alpha/beta fold hydrolase n=1 Tax=Ottowia thiooxydans TaxID=219182 RepID=UPI00041790A3|nr:alpha/beta hydrolase [Ottowia thiooxydans]